MKKTVKDPVLEAVNINMTNVERPKRKYKKRKIVLVKKRFCPKCDKIVNAVYKNNKCRECGKITHPPDKEGQENMKIKREYKKRYVVRRKGRSKFKRTWLQRKRMSEAQKLKWATKKENGNKQTSPKFVIVDGVKFVNQAHLVAHVKEWLEKNV